ncbi:MAG: DUF501 domain-containing protein [Coriobacteriia bacterium]|nr:DUF501 domain-containing protein [Coriobacteriia bacterium]
MSDDPGAAQPPSREALLVAEQLGGRVPREPWRVAARCAHGFPTVIVSPSLLADGTPFPTFAWLTCPHLSEALAAEESAGATAVWATRAAADPALAESLRAADGALRAARVAESGGVDACESVGLAGQRDPLGVKCLHAHVALVLIGIDDPIGAAELGKIPHSCPDGRCTSLQPTSLLQRR